MRFLRDNKGGIVDCGVGMTPNVQARVDEAQHGNSTCMESEEATCVVGGENQGITRAENRKSKVALNSALIVAENIGGI